MEQKYNWKAIFSGASAPSIAMFFVFRSGMLLGWKWFYLILGILLSIGITYYFDKKKHNMFTAPFIVIIVSLVVHGLRNLGLI